MPTSVRVPGLVLTEHEVEVPLDHDAPGGERITVFAREIAVVDGEGRPPLAFFQGGPGYEGARPSGNPPSPAWLPRALKDFRVIMLDQRGTGRSAPIDASATSERLKLFRADAIVRDAELVREALGHERWAILGQSFGGLCVTSYLCHAPERLTEAFVTGGLPPIGPRTDEVYAATWARTLERNRRYHARYPGARARFLALVAHLDDHDVRLPCGDRLTARRARQIGRELGMSDGAERVHHLLELPFDSLAFLHDMEAATALARNPIYAVLHEQCWADGGATRWSAERLMPAEFAERRELLFGEHMFRWIFEDQGGLAALREPADALAEHDWPRLYDAERLRAASVPVAAAIY